MKIVDSKHVTTLLLDFKFAPVGLINARNAFTYFYTGKMNAFDKDYTLYKDSNDWYHGSPALYDDQPVICSSTTAWTIPTILQCDSKYLTTTKRRRVSLKEMCVISNYTCQICFKKHPYSSLTREHIKPRSKKGTNEMSNITITCKKCNSKKDSKYPYHDVHGQELGPLVIDGMPVINIDKFAREEWKTFVKKAEK